MDDGRSSRWHSAGATGGAERSGGRCVRLAGRASWAGPWMRGGTFGRVLESGRDAYLQGRRDAAERTEDAGELGELSPAMMLTLVEGPRVQRYENKADEHQARTSEACGMRSASGGLGRASEAQTQIDRAPRRGEDMAAVVG